eukprot:TRINITY_DN5675_c0_g1_i1.p1 TRINITY_DN5675_c0_g1~~TRINITY_DN5675_c0_g1_i1.p1  ORF type:complete len:257 (+),score=76.17 TRINITY_DN5675_c0_g1_i1:90-773(+)
MSEEDKEYLRRNNIHQLLDQLAKDIIQRKPDNPQLFVIDWLRKKEEEEEAKEAGGAAGEDKSPGLQAQTAAAGGSLRRKSKPTAISVPEAPQYLPEVNLREWITSGTGNFVIVDVRESQEGGFIKGSVHVPCAAIIQDPSTHAERWGASEAVVFTSMQSPDLDMTAGMPIMQALHDKGSQAQVYVLNGGLFNWMREFHGEAALVEGYDAAKWEKIFASEQPAAPAAQ